MRDRKEHLKYNCIPSQIVQEFHIYPGYVHKKIIILEIQLKSYSIYTLFHVFVSHLLFIANLVKQDWVIYL